MELTENRQLQTVIVPYTEDRIEDVIEFERELRRQEDFWGWEIDAEYIRKVRASFHDPSFADSLSFLAYADGKVAGRIDCSMIRSRFDGAPRAYLDWICVLRDKRHKGVAQQLLNTLKAALKEKGIDSLVAITAANEEAQSFYRSIPDSEMRDTAIWIEIK